MEDPKTMKVTELKEIYDKFVEATPEKSGDDFPFNQYVKIEEYIPIAAKIDIAQKAAVEVYTEENGYRSYDKIVSDIIKSLTIISLYTDLEYDEDTTFEAYDFLTSMGFFDYLIDMDYEDIYRFKAIYDDIIYQLVDEYNSLPSVVNRGLLRLENRIVDAIDNFAEKANINPAEMDKLKESLLNINSTIDRVSDVKSADIIEAYKDKGDHQ